MPAYAHSFIREHIRREDRHRAEHFPCAENGSEVRRITEMRESLHDGGRRRRSAAPAGRRRRAPSMSCSPSRFDVRLCSRSVVRVGIPLLLSGSHRQHRFQSRNSIPTSVIACARGCLRQWARNVVFAGVTPDIISAFISSRAPRASSVQAQGTSLLSGDFGACLDRYASCRVCSPESAMLRIITEQNGDGYRLELHGQHYGRLGCRP